MSSLNRATLLGNLGKDPEVKHFEGGAVKASFVMATTERYTKKNGEKVDNTEWHNIVAWRGLALVIERYVKKGSKVYVEGRIKTRSWDDDKGFKRYMTEIEATNLILVDSRGNAVSTEAPSSQGGDDLPF